MMGELSQYAPEAASAEFISTPPVRSIPLLEIYVVLQTRELREHKYYLSQQRGFDVGRDFMVEHWVESGHALRFKEQFYANHDAIENACAQRCGERCAVYDVFDRLRHDAETRRRVVEEYSDEERTSLDGLSSNEMFVRLKEYLTKRCPLPIEELHDLIEVEGERRARSVQNI